MDRRSFGKLMGLLGCAACAPHREDTDMSRMGDILARLAEGTELTRSEINTLRFEGNNMQLVASRSAGLLDSKGDLNSEALGGHFSTLPHECASMARDTPLSIPHATATKVTFEETADLSADFQTYEFGHGIKRDYTNNEILLRGSPGQSVWLMIGWIGWGADTSATRQGHFIEKTSARGLQFAQTLGVQSFMSGSHLRVARQAEEAWRMEVSQTSGGAIDVDYALFQVVRLR